MFGFGQRKRQRDVKRLLQGRINRAVLQRLDDKARNGSRCHVCEVAWVIPCGARPLRPQYDEVLGCVTRDISEQGLSFIHTEPVTDEWLLLGLEGDVEMFFLRGSVEHCTPLGYGYYQIGVNPQETVDVEPHDIDRMRGHLAARMPMPAAAGV
jgi:hypothetical protein